MLYLHIPYCKSKCIYCNFYSSGNPDWQKYLKAVVSELSRRIDELGDDCLSSIYIGGGTPSLIPVEAFSQLMDDVRILIEKNGINLRPDAEITMEVNPEDVNIANVEGWKKAGVSRISIGVQSLDDEELRLMRRRHSARKALEAMYLLKNNFTNVSVDLIYGIPGQSPESLRCTLTELLKTEPAHVSLYSLTFEEKTPLYVFRDKGIISEKTEEEYINMSDLASEMLRERGYDRYEISNYCKPGFHSRHNSGYWSGKPYLGLGPSACSYDGNRIRRSNPSDIKRYINYFTSEAVGTPFYFQEELTPEEREEEIIFTRLRTKRGISLNKFEEEFGKKAKDSLTSKASRWISDGQLEIVDMDLKLTAKGIHISDYIILSLI